MAEQRDVGVTDVVVSDTSEAAIPHMLFAQQIVPDEGNVRPVSNGCLPTAPQKRQLKPRVFCTHVPEGCLKLGGRNMLIVNASQDVAANRTRGVACGLSGAQLTGAGRAFSAGGDMEMFAETVDPAYQRRQSDIAKLRLEKMGRRLIDEWEQFDQVTIAAINGFAVGGGFSLATPCDFRIAAAGVRMWVSEVILGMPFMWRANTRLINLVGMGKAKEMVMTGDVVTAEEALAIGLVNQVSPPDTLHEVTQAFADKLLGKPPMALRRTKEFFAALHTNRAGDIMYADAHLGLVTFASKDMRETVAAFREKR